MAFPNKVRDLKIIIINVNKLFNIIQLKYLTFEKFTLSQQTRLRLLLETVPKLPLTPIKCCSKGTGLNPPPK